MSEPDTSAITEIDVDEVLKQAGFDSDRSVLTRRQAEVLALRERNAPQMEIANLLGTSRANISSVEASARKNVQKARETVAFADALIAPVHVEIRPETDLYDIPRQVYQACDEADLKVEYSAPELMKTISDAANDAIVDRKVKRPLLIWVSIDGTINVRRSSVDR